MLVAYFIMGGLVGLKINEDITSPWWMVILSMLFVWVVGLFISGVVSIKFMKGD